MSSHERWIAHFDNGQSNTGERNLRDHLDDCLLAHSPNYSDNGWFQHVRYRPLTHVAVVPTDVWLKRKNRRRTPASRGRISTLSKGESTLFNVLEDPGPREESEL